MIVKGEKRKKAFPAQGGRISSRELDHTTEWGWGG